MGLRWSHCSAPLLYIGHMSLGIHHRKSGYAPRANRCQCGNLTAQVVGSTRNFISQKVIKKSFFKSQFLHESVNSFSILVITKDKLTDLCKNGLLQNNFVNTICESDFEAGSAPDRASRATASQNPLAKQTPATQTPAVASHKCESPDARASQEP